MSRKSNYVQRAEVSSWGPGARYYHHKQLHALDTQVWTDCPASLCPFTPMASSIPNLFTLRGGTRGGRGRTRGRGGIATGAGPDHDAVIQGTDTDAAVSRSSAVDIGLLDDPFAQYFVQGGHGVASRRLPIINRGQPLSCSRCVVQA